MSKKVLKLPVVIVCVIVKVLLPARRRHPHPVEEHTGVDLLDPSILNGAPLRERLYRASRKSHFLNSCFAD